MDADVGESLSGLYSMLCRQRAKLAASSDRRPVVRKGRLKSKAIAKNTSDIFINNLLSPKEEFSVVLIFDAC